MPATLEQKQAARKELAKRELIRRGRLSAEGVVSSERETRPLKEIFSSSEPVGRIPEGEREDVRTILSRKDIPLKDKLTLMLPTDTTENLIKKQKEVVGPGSGFISDALFGLPKLAAKRFGVAEEIFPEQSTLGGKIQRFIGGAAGLMGGGAAKLATKAGSLFKGATQRFLPKTVEEGVGLVAPKGMVTARRHALAVRDAIKGGVEGGTFGLTQQGLAGEDSSQVQQGMGGFVLGSAGSLAGKAIGEGVTGARKFFRPKRVERPIDVVIKQTKSNIDEAIKKTNELKKETLTTHKFSLQKNLQDTTKQFKDNVKVLDDALDSESELVAREVQKKLPELYRSNSVSYGQRLDEISDDLIQKGEQVVIRETDQLFNKTLADLDEALIDEGPARSAIEKLKGKYSIKETQEISKIIDPNTGRPLITKSINNMDDPVVFKELVEDIKSVKKLLSSGAKSGTTRFSQEDIAVAVLNKNLGEILGPKVDGLTVLNESYAPIIRAMKTSNRLFKPFKGEFETKTATNLLKRFGLGEAERGERELIRAIEQGSDFAPGVGPISSSVRQKGQELIAAKERIQPILNEMRRAGTSGKMNIEKGFADKLNDLRNSQKFVNSDFVQKEELIKGALADRLKTLGFRKKSIDDLLADKQKLKTLLIRFSIGTSAVGGGAYLLRQFGMRGEQ